MGKAFWVAFIIFGLLWFLAMLIVILDAKMPKVAGETAAQWLKRFQEKYPGPRTWILLGGLYGGAGLLLLWTLFDLLKAFRP